MGRNVRGVFPPLFAGARITCVDTFEGGAEHHDPGSNAFSLDVSGVEGRFDRNLAAHRDRVTKIKSRSVPAVDMLASHGRTFDLIYIDGSHRRDDVFADTALSWRLLRVGGVLIWDDWQWELDAPSWKRPEHAINLFQRAFASCLTVLHRGYQLIVRKTRDWPV